MMKTTLVALATALFLTIANAQNGCPRYRLERFEDATRLPSGLRPIVNSFRFSLGIPNNLNNPGPLAAGRREVNWDADIVPFMLPGDFFNAMVPRGLIMETKGRGPNEFRVSNSVTPPDDRFNSILPQRVSREFRRFSRRRLFTPLFENRMTATFRVPGTNTFAGVTGFGAVFADVDFFRGTSLHYFDENNCEIGKIFAPPFDAGMSFAGAIATLNGVRVPAIARVEFKLGTVSVQDFSIFEEGNFNGDVVVMDDFIYGEPQAL